MTNEVLFRIRKIISHASDKTVLISPLLALVDEKNYLGFFVMYKDAVVGPAMHLFDVGDGLDEAADRRSTVIATLMLEYPRFVIDVCSDVGRFVTTGNDLWPGDQTATMLRHFRLATTGKPN